MIWQCGQHPTRPWGSSFDDCLLHHPFRSPVDFLRILKFTIDSSPQAKIVSEVVKRNLASVLGLMAKEDGFPQDALLIFPATESQFSAPSALVT
jgi:hypothetical protein